MGSVTYKRAVLIRYWIYLTLTILGYNSKSLALPPDTTIHSSLDHALGLQHSVSVVSGFNFFWNLLTKRNVSIFNFSYCVFATKSFFCTPPI